jgi:MFS family permease
METAPNPEAPSQKNYGTTAALIAMMLFMIALSIYSENESQWFNSYVKYISSASETANTYFYVSLMVSASGIVGAVAFIIWGCISDNSRSIHGRRKPILVIGAITTALLVYSFGLSTRYLWLFICDGILIAITSNMFHVTNRAIIPDLWETTKRGRVNTYMFFGSTCGSVFVWIFSLILLPEGTGSYDRATHQLMFAIAAIALIVSASVIWFAIKEPPPTELPPPRPWTQSLGSLFNIKEMKKYPAFLKLFAASLFQIMAGNAFKPFILILLQEFSITRQQIVYVGLLLAVSIVTVIYLMMSRLDKIGRKKVTFIGLLITPIGFLFIGFSNGGILPLIIGLIIAFPFLTGLEISVNTWTQDLLPENERGKFLGVINITKAAGQAPGALLAGVLADNFGLYSVFILAAAFLLVSIPLFRIVPETVHKK